MAWDTNLRHIRAALAAARNAGVSILCLPELCITGYGCEDMFFSAGVQHTALDYLQQAIPDTKRLFTCFRIAAFYEAPFTTRLRSPATGGFWAWWRSSTWPATAFTTSHAGFRRWPAGHRRQHRNRRKQLSIGDLYSIAVACGSVLRFAAMPGSPTGRALGFRSAAADVLLNPSASHFAFAKQQIRERFVLEGSRAFQVSYAYANLLGKRSGTLDLRRRHAHRHGGKMLARGPRFLVRRLAAHDGSRRRQQHAPEPRTESFLDTNPRPAAASEAAWLLRIRPSTMSLSI